MASDGELLIRWRRGDRDALAVLYERHRRPVFVHLLSLVGQRETAEDLLHETFLRLLRARCGERGASGSLGPYLAAVARNLATDWRRRRGCDRRARESIGLLAGPAPGRSPELTPDEASELLWKLPAEQREAIVLRIYAGLSFAEIGRVTGAPLHTAVSRYRYGLAKIRESLLEVSSDSQADA